jgi:murein DD-endopeptidase MepM/ murein hydrolase activator NlpD
MRKVFTVIFFILILLGCVNPVSAQESNGPVYVVQPGDTLSSIASRFNISVDDLMAANGIADPNLLGAGQQLMIPGLEGITGVLDTELINFGDSYHSLMRRTQIAPELFRKLNRIVSPTEFYVGASMIIPQQANAPSYASMSPRAGESMLEMAVRNNTDAWTVSGLNNLSGPSVGLPGDTLYAPGTGSGQASSGLPSTFESAVIPYLPIKQGGTAEIIVKTLPGVTLGGVLVDFPLHFFPTQDGTQIALQGVHALLEPGLYPLRLEASLPDGTKQSYEQMVLIISGNYPDDPLLYVDPITIDPAATEPELQQLMTITTPSNPEKLWTGDFISPAIQYADSTYFTSRYGNRRTYIGQGTELSVDGFHTGLDFGGGVGLPITAPAAGRVVFASFWTVRGNATIIDHGWGVYSGFWHQSEFKVQVGDIVQQGQIIGLVGGTGRITGPHLHWELWVNGVQVDPLDWLSQPYP